MIALSFWIDLAWAWFTHQGKDSFYVGAAVIAAGMWFFIDSILFVIGISYAVRGLWKKRVTNRKFNRMSPSMAGFLGDLTSLKSAV